MRRMALKGDLRGIAAGTVMSDDHQALLSMGFHLTRAQMWRTRRYGTHYQFTYRRKVAAGRPSMVSFRINGVGL